MKGISRPHRAADWRMIHLMKLIIGNGRNNVRRKRNPQRENNCIDSYWCLNQYGYIIITKGTLLKIIIMYNIIYY